MSYGLLQHSIANFIRSVVDLGLQRGERIAIYLEKRLETVIASFGATAAGRIFVPLNPLLKADQVAHILRDWNVQALITSPERLPLLASVLPTCHNLRHLIVVNPDPLPASGGLLDWLHRDDLLQTGAQSAHRVIDTDMAAILHTSGNTDNPKGVVLLHRNMVAGTRNLDSADGTPLATLPLSLSFDAGFSQPSTAFHAGARAGDGSHRGAAAVHPALPTGMAGRHRRTSAQFRQYRRTNATRNSGFALRKRLPLPAHMPSHDAGLVLPEIAVFSGDTVRRDEEGFLYFIGQRDEMMKTSGYRVNPTEVEDQFPVENGELVIGRIPLTRLAARVGQTPFYAYDRFALKRRIALPASVKPHYAMKANPMPALVCQMARLVDGIDVASGSELKVALDAGADPREISFAVPGKQTGKLRQSVAAGILVNIESFREVAELAKISDDFLVTDGGLSAGVGSPAECRQPSSSFRAATRAISRFLVPTPQES
ncbi:Diaminopimelate decarboxylase [Candidatus Accumulibacter phosphatis]|uniref:Diaminopimelate decarboxylase n=2 Tax=Candidatus Accumulibacter phosphatis TaxID=327160 RepID=A0A5S4EQR7_9PROT|nr:Diaminopimelate decarboxylase [Candidatus Accumulibacter phosphatis]